MNIANLFQEGWGKVDEQVIDVAKKYAEKKLKLTQKPAPQITQYYDTQSQPLNYTKVGIIAIAGLLVFWVIYRKWIL